MIALDTETALIQPGLQAPPLVCVSLATQDSATLWAHYEAREVVREILQGQDQIVGHNVAYDMGVLAQEWPDLQPLIWRAYQDDRVTDTMLRQQLSDVAGGVYRGYTTVDGRREKIGYSLADLARRHLGLTLDKEWQTGYGPLRDVPLDWWPQEAREYPLADARATLAVWRAQEVASEGYLADQYRQARAAFWLRLMSAWGMVTDREGVEAFRARVESERRALAQDLRVAGFLRTVGRAETRDTKAAGQALIRAYQAQGRDYPRTDTGRPSLELTACEESGDPVLEAYGRYGRVNALLAKDIPMLLRGVDHPIHPHVETILETGRTSMSPNLQNLSRAPGVRECFVPRQAGLVFLAADYGGLELCTLAQVCLEVLGRSALAQALNEGRDPHLEVGAAILGIPYAEAQARRKAGDQDVERARQVGKVANFGFPGGLGPGALVHYARSGYGVQVSEDQARDLKDAWIRSWPEMMDYFRWIASHTDKPFPQIRQIYADRWRGGVSYTEACNTMFQGLGADVAKAAGWLVSRQCYGADEGPLTGWRIVNFVHDELILEGGPEETVHDAGQELARLMIEAARPWLPGVQIHVEVAAMRRWSKRAKPAYQDGRLVPWQAS